MSSRVQQVTFFFLEIDNSTYRENYRALCKGACKLEVMGLIDVRIYNIFPLCALSPLLYPLCVYVAYFSNCERCLAVSCAISSSSRSHASINTSLVLVNLSHSKVPVYI